MRINVCSDESDDEAGHNIGGLNDSTKLSKRPQKCVVVEQGSLNLSLEGQSAAEFSSNPDQTHLAVIF